MTYRVILDTSVFIAALINSEGSIDRFISRVDAASDVQIIWSQKVGYELTEKVQTDPYIISRMRKGAEADMLQFMEQRAVIVADATLDHPLPLANDRDDDYLIALARQEKAVLVTLDQKLINSRPDDVEVMRPWEFETRLAQ